MTSSPAEPCATLSRMRSHLAGVACLSLAVALSCNDGGASGPLTTLEVAVAGADLAGPLPLIVALHGGGGAGGDLPARIVELFKEFDVPARLVVPRGPHGSIRRRWYSDERWETMSREVWEDADRVAATIEQASRAHPTLGRPILIGISGGGGVAMATAIRHPALLQAAVMISGALPSEVSEPVTGVKPKIWILHGRRDDRMELQWAEATGQELRKLGFDVQLSILPEAGHAFEGPMRDETFRVLRSLIGTAAEG